jgi:hypothetical protein
MLHRIGITIEQTLLISILEFELLTISSIRASI